MSDFTESELEAFRAALYGEKRGFAYVLNGSIATYPDSADPDQRAIAAICAELARRGLLRSRLLLSLPDQTAERCVWYYSPRNSAWDDT